jgi:effector-binding domain-containing protein
MKVAKWILIILLVLLAAAASYLYYLGIFSSVVVQEKTIEPMKLVYRVHYGDYRQIGKVIDGVYASLEAKFKIKATKGFGIYYDNPKATETNALRSIGGCILEEKDYAKLPQIEKKFKISTMPSSKCVVIEFPYKQQLFIMAGIIKVYPELEKYLHKKGYKEAPVMEIYDTANKKIVYISPIRK